MKLVTKIATIATIASFMFAGMNITWGNNYADNGGDLASTSSFGCHFDVNDNTTLGWEGGLMLGLAGPAGTTIRLGMGFDIDAGVDNDVDEEADNFSIAVPTLGVSYTWWEGAGTGWGTTLSTAMDFQMVDGADGDGDDAVDSEAGDFSITINLGFGF
jgi:hypothetical protein